MSIPLQADAAHTAASGSPASGNDALYRRIGMRIVPFLFISRSMKPRHFPQGDFLRGGWREGKVCC
ncbi:MULTISPECIES: hypothetical protein [unclassified Burkholderia]|uniref:hypothetical protein n=1 Tax=unclassified Burkholderia TaxID=2613784 RepID=UPI001423774D|nr:MULTISPECIES: hypothetical protein [unclassified Burkholderia]NIE59507.1 hypothetical protein [Burkholderia sp. Ap-955]NIF11364.1 hypothetical protein [Burkholderia sp. Ax-1735]NIG04516.1 hypothetical protein [Burkholderia sp. Tr-849]